MRFKPVNKQLQLITKILLRPHPDALNGAIHNLRGSWRETQ